MFANKRKSNLFMVICICILALLVGGCSACLALFNGAVLSVVPVGQAEMTVEYGSEYKENGATVWFDGFFGGNKILDREYQVSGTVNADLLGEYKVEYSTRFLWKSAKGTRIVRVVDTKAPVITLKSDPDHYTLPGKDYVEEGFIAFDNHDGDITALVQRVVDGDTVIYKVKDSSGNEAEVRRSIKYDDLDAPLLTLNGDTTVTLEVGQAFTEPGYTAVDNVEGDITSKVQISGEYNIYFPGTYVLEYSVTDNYGNTTKVQRTLVIKAPEVVIPTGKVIYLTFDDGPGQYTEKLLQILAKYNVKATFFVVKTEFMHLLKDIDAAGHTIALHSYTHDYAKIYSSDDAFFADLNQLNDAVYQQIGRYINLMRFPGGSSNVVSRNYSVGIMSRLTKAVEAKGFRYFDWNVDSKDAGGTKNADVVFQNVVDGIGNKKTSVILQHDIHGYSVDAVEKIIVWGLANGYTFLPLEYSSYDAHHNVRN